MKKIYLILSAVLVTLTLHAQTNNTGWSMRYVKEHHLMTNGAETNVVDLDLEWPDVIDFKNVEPLRSYLAQKLFDVQATTYPAAYRAFMARQGEEVTQKFDSIPDDDKFCYTDVKLTYLGGKTNQFVSFMLSADVEPMAKSSQIARHLDELITYDLVDKRVLHAQDLLRNYHFRGEWKGDVYQIVAYFGGDYYEYVDVTQCCLLEDALQVYFLVNDDAGNPVLVPQTISFQEIRPLMSKVAKSLEKDNKGDMKIDVVPKEVTALNGQYKMLPGELVSQDSMQSMNRRIMEYIGKNFRVPQGNQMIGGRIIVSFVLDSLGYAQEPRIMKSVDPEFDRELVKTIKLMPRQTTVAIDGKNYDHEVILPVHIRLQ
ncbi:MAG: hypothetical protein ACOYJG_06240 [Prevotella sp.]|jgi:hypothetical protein